MDFVQVVDEGFVVLELRHNSRDRVLKLRLVSLRIAIVLAFDLELLFLFLLRLRRYALWSRIF